MVEYALECTFGILIQQIMHKSALKALNVTPCSRLQPDWWWQVAYTGTKLLYQPEPNEPNLPNKAGSGTSFPGTYLPHSIRN